jgi:hypothetical protein
MSNPISIVLNDSNWMPVEFRYINQQPEIRWMYFGDLAFQEPFFEDTIIRCKQLSKNTHTYWTNVQELIRVAESANFLSPGIFIFHVSRCGSTLQSQAFALRKDCIVLSEVPLLDQLLRFSLQQTVFSEDEINAWVIAALKLLGRKRTNLENYLLVKCDSWHVFFYQRIRKLFPQAKVSLLTRHPYEVFQSQLKSPGLHAVSGMLEPQLFHLSNDKLAQLHPHQYLAYVLEFYQHAFGEIIQTDSEILLQDYRDGIFRLLNDLLSLVGIPEDVSWWRDVETRFQFHSKRPEQKFKQDADLKMRDAPDCIRPAVHAYEALINLRK